MAPRQYEKSGGEAVPPSLKYVWKYQWLISNCQVETPGLVRQSPTYPSTWFLSIRNSWGLPLHIRNGSLVCWRRYWALHTFERILIPVREENSDNVHPVHKAFRTRTAYFAGHSLYMSRRPALRLCIILPARNRNSYFI